MKSLALAAVALSLCIALLAIGLPIGQSCAADADRTDAEVAGAGVAESGATERGTRESTAVSSADTLTSATDDSDPAQREDANTQQASPEPANPEDASAPQSPPTLLTATGAGPLRGPRDLLAMFDIDQTFFDTFVDDEPVAFDEQEKLFRLLYRDQRITLLDAHRWLESSDTWQKLLDTPRAYRGQLFHIEGMVTRVDRLPLTPELEQRFELSQAYRVRLTAADGTPVYVLTGTIPKAWPVGAPMQEGASLVGMFVKRSRATTDDFEERPLIFVAPRVAWNAATSLGALGMDVGLLDDVQDRRVLSDIEREAFYQMLAAVGRADPDELVEAARRHFAERRTKLMAEIAALAPHSPQRMRAELELEAARQNLSDAIGLFLEPAARRGALAVIEGYARRVVEVRLDEPDVVERFGIRRYYELQIFTDDSQGNPIVCCVRELPDGMPQGESVHERVRVTGFFFKSWLYRANPAVLKDAALKENAAADRAAAGNADGQRAADEFPLRGEPRRVVQRWAPLIIGRVPQWLPAPGLGINSLGNWIVGSLVVFGAVLFAWVWRAAKKPRRTYREILRSGGESAAVTAPDFSQLERRDI